MDKINIHTNQLNCKQEPLYHCSSEVQFIKKVFALRQSISQIVAHPKKMKTQHWKQLTFNIANVFSDRQCIDQLVDCLKQQQLQQTQRQKKRNQRSNQDEDQQKTKIIRYFLQPIGLLNSSNAQKIWKYRQIYFSSEILLQQLGYSESQKQNRAKLVQILLMNKIICCFKLQIYEKALESVQLLYKINSPNDSQSLNQLQFLKKSILLKMGCRLDNYSIQRDYGIYKIKESELADKSRKDKQLCFKIAAFDKKSLLSFLQHLRDKTLPFSVRNLYNLALVCKKHKQFQFSKAILKILIDLQQQEQQNRLKCRCLVLLSEIEQENCNLRGALEALKLMKVEDQTDKNQWHFRKLRLQKKLKIENASKTCPIFGSQSARKYKLLCGLQNQLNRLKDEKQKTEAVTKKNVSKLYQIINRKKTVKKIVFLPELTAAKSFDFETKTTSKRPQLSLLKINYQSIQSTQMHTKQELLYQLKQSESQVKQPDLEELINNQPLQSKLTQRQINEQKKEILTQINEVIQTQVIQSQIKQKISQQELFKAQSDAQSKERLKNEELKSKQTKKEVKFQTQFEEQSQIVPQIIYKGEQKIAYLLLSQAFQQIVPEIQSILERLYVEKYCLQTQRFIVKSVNWYRMLGKQSQAVSLLKLAISNTKAQIDGPKFKKHCLKLLGEIYQQLKNSKQASNVYLQLANLGQIDYYDKLGQLQLFRQQYADAIKYFEIYHEAKQDLYSKSKLAHAYSKMAIYKKKAVDLLNQMLFSNKNFIIFKSFQIEEIQAVQNAVLLLASIYMNHQFGSERAKNICQKFLQIDFSAYPVYYMLGVIYEHQGKKQEAFQKYLTALKLKPTHLPSLIKIVGDIGIGNSNNFEIINILRKAFVQNNRNWQLLQLLVQSITLAKRQVIKPSVEQLVRCAKVLQRAQVKEGDMELQIEMVWTWAFQVVEQRRRKEQVIEDEYQNEINMKLGEINMAKGNLKASQFYLNKVLAKLELRRKRTARRRGVMKFQLEALQKLSYIKARQNQSSEVKPEPNVLSKKFNDFGFEEKLKNQKALLKMPAKVI